MNNPSESDHKRTFKIESPLTFELVYGLMLPREVYNVAPKIQIGCLKVTVFKLTNQLLVEKSVYQSKYQLLIFYLFVNTITLVMILVDSTAFNSF